MSGRTLTLINYNGRARLFYQDERNAPANISRVILYLGHEDLSQLLSNNGITVQAVVSVPERSK